jgi:hypothetical protein
MTLLALACAPTPSASVARSKAAAQDADGGLPARTEVTCPGPPEGAIAFEVVSYEASILFNPHAPGWDGTTVDMTGLNFEWDIFGDQDLEWAGVLWEDSDACVLMLSFDLPAAWPRSYEGRHTYSGEGSHGNVPYFSFMVGCHDEEYGYIPGGVAIAYTPGIGTNLVCISELSEERFAGAVIFTPGPAHAWAINLGTVYASFDAPLKAEGTDRFYISTYGRGYTLDQMWDPRWWADYRRREGKE